MQLKVIVIRVIGWREWEFGRQLSFDPPGWSSGNKPVPHALAADIITSISRLYPLDSHPNLSSHNTIFIALLMFVCIFSQVTIEGDFSSLKLILTDNRNRMNHETLEDMYIISQAKLDLFKLRIQYSISEDLHDYYILYVHFLLWLPFVLVWIF